MHQPEPQPPEAISPTGQLVGLTALLNKMPPQAMNALICVVGLAVLVEMFPEGLPAVVLLVASKVTKAAIVLGIASAGARK